MQQYRLGRHLATLLLTVVFGAGAPRGQDSLRISIEDFERLAESAHTLIDVRDEGMFAKGHIPKAILIPLEDIETSASRLRGLKQPFITYCS
jgi:rhodanese-related sulfurtransferase